MVKKKFIDKNKAVTYNLVYRSTEDADQQPERMLVEADKGVGLGRVDVDALTASQPSTSRYPPGHPLAWLEAEANAAPIKDARRQELIELGFEDDGYDYLQHLRTVGRGSASIEGLPATLPPISAPDDADNDNAAEPSQQQQSVLPPERAATTFGGPSVVIKAPTAIAPEEDIALFDASRLTVMTSAANEEGVEGLLGGVSAFSRKQDKFKGADSQEVKEIAALMKALEEEDIELDEETEILDDFIVAATAMGEYDHQEEEEQEEDGSYYSSEEDEDESEEEYTDSDDDGTAQGNGTKSLTVKSRRSQAGPGSIASTYWRAERSDRRNHLPVLDERFEHLALEYDEREMETEEFEPEIPDDARGVADVSQFEDLLDEFITQHGRGTAADDPNAAPRVHSVIREQLEAYGMDDNDAEIALLKAKEAVLRAENEPETSNGDQELMLVRERKPKEKWDCESVLSMRSNLDNHPGTITEPGNNNRSGFVPGKIGGTGSGKAGVIRLNKFGMPMGVVPPHHTRLVAHGAAGDGDGVLVDSGSETEDEEDDGGDDAGPVVILERKKGETAEEKKARKASVKNAKKEARVAKKDLKELYKSEAKRAHKRAATAQVQPTVIL